MPKFADGVMRFQKEVFPKKKALFEALSFGQTPEALFITCSDSRIETAMFTQSEPGELFVCRNAGNIVPPHTNQTGGMTASIEFAVAVLQVPHIVICGHAGCGAMEAARRPEKIAKLGHVREWLCFAQAAVDIVEDACSRNGDAMDEAARDLMMVEQNVILQIQHLKTHPTVALRLARGDIELHGWVYDVTTGDVRALDERANKFVPVAEYYKKS